MSRILKSNQDNEKKNKSFKSFINFAMNFDEPKDIDNQDEEAEFIAEKENDFVEEELEEKPSFDLIDNNNVLNNILSAQIKEDEIINKAELEAQKILKDAKEEAEIIKSRAYAVGFDSGKQEGYNIGKAEAKEKTKEESIKEINELKYNVAREIKLVEAEKEKILENHIEDLKEIAIAVGEKIALTSLKNSKNVIEKMILEATEKMKKSSWAKIYIGYNEEAINIKGDTLFLEKLSRLADNVQVIIMQTDEEGTCIIETPNGTKDISVKTQISNIRDIVKNTK